MPEITKIIDGKVIKEKIGVKNGKVIKEKIKDEKGTDRLTG